MLFFRRFSFATMLLLLLTGFSMVSADEPAAAEEESVVLLDGVMKKLDGTEVDLAKYRGKVVLIVNVASKCGLTRKNYTQLEKIYKERKDDGLVILGFPCNQFGSQEPGSAEDIQNFCSKNFGVTFDIFEKVKVNGDDACALYQKMKAIDSPPVGTGEIQWNFEKFLIDRNGELVGRFSPRTEPGNEDLLKAINDEIAKPAP